MEKYETGRFSVPVLSDGGVFYPHSQIGVYKPNPIPKGKITAGFFGAAYGEYEPKDKGLYKATVQRMIILGEEFAKKDVLNVTGAAPGIPHQAAYGASRGGGIVVGIAPVGNESLHINDFMKTVTMLQGLDGSLVNEWDTKPLDPYNLMFYLNIGHRSLQRRFVQRDLTNVYCSRIAVFADGDAGTNHEAAVGRELGGRVIAILKNSGGVSEYLEAHLAKHLRKRNDTIALAYEDPYALANKAYEAAIELHEKRRGIDDTFDFMVEQAELTMRGMPFEVVHLPSEDSHKTVIGQRLRVV